jgi:hypothetical protein
MKEDNTIIPSDIAIIMRKSSNNYIYEQLRDTLTKLYKKKGYKNNVYHMSTNCDGRHIPLDWSKAEENTILLSIHGDKGKGHKVVFLVGLSEKSIPNEHHTYKPIELISESLLNVGITRSTKYLFIGFNRTYASRYLYYKRDNLNKYAYLSWDEEQNIPEPYNSIIKNQKFDKPYWEKSVYNEMKINTGSKSELKIKDDISKDFEQAHYFIDYEWQEESIKKTFGKKQIIKTVFQKDHYCLLGIMSEILIQRIINKKELFSNLKINKNSIFTDDECYLSCMYDVRYMDTYSFEDYIKKYYFYFDKNKELLNKIRDSFKNKQQVIPKIFENNTFQEQLKEFMSDKDNNMISTVAIWNVTLFYNQITQNMYKPSINTFYGYLNEDISILHKNIDNYINTNNFLENKNITFEENFNINYKNFTDEELEILNKDRHEISIVGRLDIYDKNKENLIECKASNMNDCSEQWIIQTLCYLLLLNVYQIPVKIMTIVNLLKGCSWEWDISDLDLPKIENIIMEKIKNKYNLHEIETENLIKQIENIRNNKK